MHAMKLPKLSKRSQRRNESWRGLAIGSRHLSWRERLLVTSPRRRAAGTVDSNGRDAAIARFPKAGRKFCEQSGVEANRALIGLPAIAPKRDSKSRDRRFVRKWRITLSAVILTDRAKEFSG